VTALAKASLQELTGDRNPTESGAPIDVQFNPASLRLQMTNNVEGGKTTTRPVEQHTGTSSDTLTLELVFDTADEGTTQSPRNVRERTAEVAKFVRPKDGSGGSKQTPPRVRFQWGDFLFEGVMTSYSEDLDLFASTGVPLRAKVSVSIQGQDPKYESLASGPGAATGAGAKAPGGLGGAGAALNRVATALGGESAAGLAARLGLDPSAWRGLSFGGGSPLSLGAGLEVGFSASLSASVGIGVRAGVEAGLGVSLEARLGLAAGTAVGVSSLAPGQAGGATTPAAAAQGVALTSAGGVGAALETAKIARSREAATQALQAFAAPGAPAAAAPSAPLALLPAPSRPAPLRTTAQPSAAARGAAPPAPPPPQADARAISFGLGVPLRARVTGAARTPTGPPVIAARPPDSAVPLTEDPTVAPWTQLPAAHAARAAADDVQRQRRPVRPCGCGGGSGCRCGCQEDAA
jgi:Contractile injection system tube protein